MTVTIEAAYQHPSASMKQWANTQSQAILAVDNIHPSPLGTALDQAIIDGQMTHDIAVQKILERANQYANR